MWTGHRSEEWKVKKRRRHSFEKQKKEKRRWIKKSNTSRCHIFIKGYLKKYIWKDKRSFWHSHVTRSLLTMIEVCWRYYPCDRERQRILNLFSIFSLDHEKLKYTSTFFYISKDHKDIKEGWNSKRKERI